MSVFKTPYLVPVETSPRNKTDGVHESQKQFYHKRRHMKLNDGEMIKYTLNKRYGNRPVSRSLSTDLSSTN